MRRNGLAPETADEQQIAQLARALPLRFGAGQVLLDGEDVTEAIRTESAGMDALASRPCPPCARRCARCSTASAAFRDWWQTGATWAR